MGGKSSGDSGEYTYGSENTFGEMAESIGMDNAERKSDGVLSELARKAMASSMSKLMETEGFVREIVKAMSREVAAYIGRELASVRQDVVDQATDKIVGWLDKVDIAGEVRKSLDGMTFDINVKVHVSDEGVQATRGRARKATAARKSPTTKRPAATSKTAPKK